MARVKHTLADFTHENDNLVDDRPCNILPVSALVELIIGWCGERVNNC